VAREERLLPLGLAKGCVLRREVRRDQAIRYEDLERIPDSLLLEMRKVQDRLCI
jgi:predicted homoserine dehydrogenase-like protein